MEERLSRLGIMLMWLSLPVLLLFSAPIKYIVCINIIWAFTVYSHGFQVIIHRDLIPATQPWPVIARIIIFGPLETHRLMKLQTISTDTLPGNP